MILYAKSYDNGNLTLAEHTDHVVRAIKALQPHLMPDLTTVELETVRQGAILHDLGKGHPFFQLSLQRGFDRSLYKLEVPHRHEISSLLFLPLFERTRWHCLIDLVVAHHKSLKCLELKKGRGLIDLIEIEGKKNVFARHSEDWDKWHTLVFPILQSYDIPTRILPLEEVREAFDEVEDYCENRGNGRSQMRGLLMAADHLASALQEETEVRTNRLFKQPDLAVFHSRAHSADADRFPLSKYSSDSPRPHTLVIAPTGSGKTDYLMRRCTKARVFYMLPFQASINAMFLRFEDLINQSCEAKDRTDIRRVHAASQIEIEDGVEEEFVMQRFPGAAIKVMTPHQTASILFGTSGHEAAALDIAGQDVILDEVHVYNEITQAMVLELIRVLVDLKARVHLGSATIPSSLQTEIVKRLGGMQNIHLVRLSDSELDTYDRHVVDKLPDLGSAQTYITEGVARHERILFVSNRVGISQDRYQWVRRAFPDVPALLLHSRFRRLDRAEKERRIGEFEQMSGPCIVCSTQVIEVSLDISFDTMITDAAPLDALVQRFGRVNRKRENKRKLARVAVIAPPDNPKSALPYDIDVLHRSYAHIEDGMPLKETGIQEKINRVYPEISLKAIDQHLVERDGAFALPELCHRAKSVLLEILEIDSLTCIRESDVDAYRIGNAKSRQQLEIPVTYPALRPFFSKWPKLEDIGSRPLICPDTCYDMERGLLLSGEGEPACIIL